MFKRLVAIIVTLAIILAAGWYVLRRPDIAFDRLESLYANAESKFMPMGESGMAEHQDHAQHMAGPKNTLPMMMGKGQFGNIEMGGMFTVLKVRDDITSYEDPGWYTFPAGSVARRVE